jgi:hypothetical protein
VLEKALAGTLNLLVKYSTLQEYGVEKAFFLENDNVDSSQRNVVFLVRGEKAKTIYSVAGKFAASPTSENIFIRLFFKSWWKMACCVNLWFST